MKKGLVITAFMIIVFISSSVLFGDTLEERLSKFAGDNGKNYMKPFITAFGTNLNTGWFQTAKVTKPFHFGIILNTMVTFIPDDDKTFTATNPFPELYKGVDTLSATVFGDDGGYFAPTDAADSAGIYILRLPSGIDLSMVPLVIPQVFFGLPKSIELTARYCPPVELSKDIGKMSFWGIGVKYQVSKLIPLCPVAIALQGTYQQLKLGDIITSNSTFFNAQASKKIPLIPITLYGGIGFESTELTAEYEYTYQTLNDPVTESVELNIKGDNEFRVTAGLKLRLLLIDICADYSLGKYSVARVGLGVSL